MVKTQKDLTGLKFGRLTVVCQSEDKITKQGNHLAMWKCQCDCGNTVNVLGTNLNGGVTKSCGCYARDKTREFLKKKCKPNIYDLSGEYGICYSHDKSWCCYFDKEDYEKIRCYKWNMNNGGYISAGIECSHSVFMHRLLLDLKSGDNLTVDHINGIPFDNRKSNLRACTMAQNSYNKKGYNKSGYKGVNYVEKEKLWKSYITFNGKVINLGCYKNPEDAVKARSEAEKKYFGDYGYEETQNIATYPTRVLMVRDEYKKYMACLGLALNKIMGNDKKEKYGKMPLIMESVNSKLNEIYTE